mgnify:CR=1 FL=1
MVHEIESRRRATVALHASVVDQLHAVHAGVAETCAAWSGAGSDPLPADNSFFCAHAGRSGRRCVVVNGGERADDSLFLSKALSIGTTPTFQGRRDRPRRAPRPASFDKRAVVRPQRSRSFPPAGSGGVLKALRRARRRPAGRIAGDRTTWPSTRSGSAAGKLGAAVDRIVRAQRIAGFPRLQPPGVRSVQGAAQRRLLRRAHLPLPHLAAESRRPRDRAA